MIKGDTHEWFKNEVNALSDPLIDPATGKPIIIREFIFSFNPETQRQIREKKIPAPTQQELFNSHVKQLRIMLWGDGLVAMEEKEFPPRMVVGKKKYKIILTCQPRQGVLVNEKIHTLQDLNKSP